MPGRHVRQETLAPPDSRSVVRHNAMHHRLVMQTLDRQIERLHEIRTRETVQAPLPGVEFPTRVVHGPPIIDAGRPRLDALSHRGGPRRDLAQVTLRRPAHQRFTRAVDQHG